MAFDVYPQNGLGQNPQPLTIAAGATCPAQLFTEHRDSGTPNTMYMRVAIVAGVADPTFQLQAGTGDAVTVPSTQGIWDKPGGPGGGGNYVGDSYKVSEGNGVYFITVLFQDPSSSIWHLLITNNDGASKNFTWVVADSDTSSMQAWIDMATVTPPLPFETLITDSDQFNLRVFNYGTGPLSGLAGTFSGTNAASFSFSASATPIPPGGLLDTSVALAPVSTSAALSATLTITSNDSKEQTLPSPGHNSIVAISGQAEQLEVAFMLDASGSMAFSPGGKSIISIAPDSTRWGMLKTAAEATLTMLGNHATGKGTFGVGMYPDITPFPALPSDPYGGPFPVTSPSANDFIATMPITVANINTVADPNTGTLEKHFTRENGAATPMGAGIARAIGLSDGSLPWGYFSNQANDINLNRRWLILMTDGNHNSSPPSPNDFIAANSFVNKKIHVATIGYGNPTPDPGAAIIAPVDTALLTQLTTAGFQNSASNYHFVNAADDPALTSGFVKTLLFSALDSESVTDPSGVLTSSSPTLTREVPISQYDQKLSFLVAWTTSNAQRLRVQVVTPLGEVLEDPGDGYTVNVNPRFRMLTFDQNFLHNTKGSPRYGTWKLILTLNEIIQEPRTRADVRSEVFIDTENYDYQVMVSSRLRLRTKLNQVSFAPGDKIQITASPTIDWQGIPNAAVTLSRNRPASGYINWLASSPVTAEEYARVAGEQKGNPDIDSLGIKHLVLAAKGQQFLPGTSSDVVNMVDSQGDGNYVAELTNTAVPGTYPFYITAVGTLADGTLFRREQSINVELVVRPDPACTFFNVVYEVLERDTTMAIMTVRPVDCFGNAVLLDPNFDPSVVFTAGAGNFQGNIVDNHDGSYTRTLIYPSGQSPNVGVVVRGTTVVSGTPLVDVSGLTFVDKVFSFKAGLEALPGANQHKDPNACLGNFTTKPSPEFVSLGGGGVLVVGCAGKTIVGQGGNDDITIFITPDQTPRAYSVEAAASNLDDENSWNLIGKSTGATQSFGLRHLSAAAIRIKDLSYGIRNHDGSASASPGISVRAVGARKVEGGGDGDICIRIRVLNPQGQPLGGTVDIEFQPQGAGETTKVSGVDASQDIDVEHLQRFPQVSVYEVTVTPTDVFRPTSQFLTIPASGFNTVVFTIKK